MARTRLDLTQGSVETIACRLNDEDLTGWEFLCEIRLDFASTTAAAAADALITVTSGSGIGDPYTPSGGSVSDSVDITLSSVMTSLLENQDNLTDYPTHRGEIKAKPPGGDWESLAGLDIYVTPRTAVPE